MNSQTASNSYPQPQEWRIVPLRECPLPSDLLLCDQPAIAVQYWRQHIATQPWFDSSRENLLVILLNVRRRILGHHLVAIGTLDSITTHPREVFRAAVLGNAHNLILVHNHPTGDCSPSDADVRVTRDLIRAGQLLKIELTDHLVISDREHQSLRELGLFH